MLIAPSFVDWWFTPWQYARAGDARYSSTGLGRRDAYRIWCRDAQVAPAFPTAFDPFWCALSELEPAELSAAAILFLGIIAARMQDNSVLNRLPLSDRKWCSSIAATQPLRYRVEIGMAADDCLETRALVELAARLEHAFAGLWSRLRLQYSTETTARVELGMHAVTSASDPLVESPVRVRRCWHLCCIRAGANVGLDEPHQVAMS